MNSKRKAWINIRIWLKVADYICSIIFMVKKGNWFNDYYICSHQFSRDVQNISLWNSLIIQEMWGYERKFCGRDRESLNKNKCFFKIIPNENRHPLNQSPPAHTWQACFSCCLNNPIILIKFRNFKEMRWATLFKLTGHYSY